MAGGRACCAAFIKPGSAPGSSRTLPWSFSVRSAGRAAPCPAGPAWAPGHPQRPGAPSCLWGLKQSQVRSEKGQSEGHETPRNVWQTKCRGSTRGGGGKGGEANRGRLFGVICLFREKSGLGRCNERGRRWGNRGKRQCPAELRVRASLAQLCPFDCSPMSLVPERSPWTTKGTSVSSGTASVCVERAGMGPDLPQGMRPSVSCSDEALKLLLERGG